MTIYEWKAPPGMPEAKDTVSFVVRDGKAYIYAHVICMEKPVILSEGQHGKLSIYANADGTHGGSLKVGFEGDVL